MMYALPFLVFVATASGQAGAPAARLLTAVEFPASAKVDKRETLNALASHRYEPVPAQEVASIISAGLLDADDDIRLSAVYAAASRAAGARFGLDDRFVAVWRIERPLLQRIRPLVLTALADTNPRIRQGAIIALGNLDHDADVGGRRIQLRDDTATALAERLNTETHPAVRIELAKSLALTQPDPRTRDRLLSALDDPQVEVAKYAIIGLAASKMPEALPRLIRFLKHRDRGVRLQVGQALAAYGSQSAAYMTEIEDALATEQDEIVKQTLEGTIAALRKAANRK